MDLSTAVYCGSAALLTVFVVEHTQRKRQSTKRPSAAITYAADKAVVFWKWMGRWAAKLSSFLTYIDVKDLMQTASDLLNPTWRLVWSFVHFLSSYVREASAAIYKHPYAVYLGSGMLVAAAGWAVMYFGAWDYATEWASIAGQWSWAQIRSFIQN